MAEQKKAGQQLEFNAENLEQMQHVQRQITKAILPYRDNTEAALVILALVGAAKILLDLYNPQSRAELAEVITAHLVNDSRIIGGDAKTKTLLSRFLMH